MRKIVIREPIWKYKAIGIREDKVTDDFQIRISYRTKDKKLLYPYTFFMTKEQIKSHPLKYLGNMFVYILPIENLHRLFPETCSICEKELKIRSYRVSDCFSPKCCKKCQNIIREIEPTKTMLDEQRIAIAKTKI